MQELSLVEAQLFTLLGAFFGRKNVIPHMRVIAICGGSLPSLDGSVLASHQAELDRWARTHRGLFTVVDAVDAPKLVFEFFSGFSQIVDPVEEEHQRFLKPLLHAAGLRYITISESEFAEILAPDGKMDFFQFLKSKIEPLDGVDDGGGSAE